MALDGAGAVGEAESGDDRVAVLADPVDEAVQGGQVVGLNALDPLVEVLALAVVHQLGEGTHVPGGSVEFGTAGEDRLEPLFLVVVETVGAAGEPAGHVPHGRGFAGRIVVGKGFAEPLHVLLHDALASGIAALAEFLEQSAGDGTALRPPLVQVGLVGIKDAGPAGPAADQELVRGGRVGETADGVAGQTEPPGDGPQPEPFVQEDVDGRVLLADPVGQAAGLPWLACGT